MSWRSAAECHERLRAVTTGHPKHVGAPRHGLLCDSTRSSPACRTTGSIPRSRHACARSNFSAFPPPDFGLIRSTPRSCWGAGVRLRARLCAWTGEAQTASASIRDQGKSTTVAVRSRSCRRRRTPLPADRRRRNAAQCDRSGVPRRETTYQQLTMNTNAPASVTATTRRSSTRRPPRRAPSLLRATAAQQQPQSARLVLAEVTGASVTSCCPHRSG